MKTEWYLTFHGGADRGDRNNLHVYDLDGRHLRKALDRDSLPPTVELRELRGFTFGPDGDLYVANSFREHSQILRFKGKLDRRHDHDFREVFVNADATTNPGLSHPFNLVFDSAGDLCVTSQNTSLVLRYHGPHSHQPGSPMPLPPALAATAAHFAPGTFCPAATQVSDGLHVVREALFDHGILYVVDRDADQVKRFDAATGDYLGPIEAHGAIDKPIHLALHRSTLFIGNRGNESVVRCDLLTGKVSPFIAPKAGGLRNPAGLAIGPDGFFYVASRGSHQILRYRLDDGLPAPRPFIDNLEDEPEFLELITRD